MPSVNLDIHAKLFRGLADPARLGLLLQLATRPRTAGELAQACALSPSNASNHLQCLLECGLVEVEARGRHNVYSLSHPAIAALLDASEQVLSTNAGRLIKACQSYGAPSRRRLRVSSPGMNGRVGRGQQTDKPA